VVVESVMAVVLMLLLPAGGCGAGAFAAEVAAEAAAAMVAVDGLSPPVMIR